MKSIFDPQKFTVVLLLAISYCCMGSPPSLIMASIRSSFDFILDNFKKVAGDLNRA